MDWKVIATFIGAAVALFGIIYNRRNSKKDATNKRISKFSDFVGIFKAKIFSAKLPDEWVPYFAQTVPELRARFESVAKDMSEPDRIKWRDQIEALLRFSQMGFAEIYQEQEAFNAALNRLGNN